tara:strand:- start:115 stop:534 length:420 start_codon:yes stop_codon:yes gene_type:complete
MKILIFSLIFSVIGFFCIFVIIFFLHSLGFISKKIPLLNQFKDSIILLFVLLLYFLASSLVYGGFFHAAFINFIIIYCVLCMTIAIAIWSFLLNILEKINLFQKGNSLLYIFIVYGFIWFGIIENTIVYPINIIKEFIK